MDSLVPFITGLVMTASATSMTGGVQASGGETIKTGDSYSSVQVENVINTDTRGGTSKTIIYTNTNGTEHTETHEEIIPQGGSVHVFIATSSSAEGSSMGVTAELRTSVDKKSISASSTAVLQNAHASSSLSETRGISTKITERVSWIFKHIVSWWSMFR